MHRTTVLFPERLWAEIQKAAKDQGVSASQYIREAALACVYYEKGQLAKGPPGATIEKIRDELRD